MSEDNIGAWRVWIVMTHGHRIDSIWTSERPGWSEIDHITWSAFCVVWRVIGNEILQTEAP